MTIVKISNLMADMYIFLYKNIICLPCAIYSASKQDNEADEELEHKRTGGPVGISGVSGTISSQFDESGVLSESLSETKSVCEEEFESFNEYEEEEESVRVPFVVIIGILVVFFFVAGVIFDKLENGSDTDLKSNEWNYVSSVYFMFISATTIGRIIKNGYLL